MPIGWRLPSAIIGTGVVAATFVTALVLFGESAAIFSSIVISFENLNLVMSRITMNDIFITFFAFISFLLGHLYVKTNKFKYLFFTSLTLGFAIASKWSGIYAIAGVGLYIVFNQFRKKGVDFKWVLLLVIPAFVYLLSYGQFWLQGHTIKDFIDLNKQIWWYENRRDLQHNYATTPLYCVPKGVDGPKTFCPWVLDVRGVYFSYESYGQKAGYIYAIGNPLIFWFGVLAISYLIGKYLEEKKREYLLIILGYFIFWVPWIFTPRILFLHHYLPSLPFLSIASGFVLSKIYQTKYKFAAILIILAFAGMFFFLYPITTGFPINVTSIDHYMILKTWR